MKQKFLIIAFVLLLAFFFLCTPLSTHAQELTPEVSNYFASAISSLQTVLHSLTEQIFALKNTQLAQISGAGSGLVAHYTFDEGSGTTAGDSSGSGNTGTLTNGPTWTTGQIGGALQFDGVNDYVNAGDNGTADIGTSNFSISFWHKMNSGNSVITKGAGGVSGYNINWISATTIRLYVQDSFSHSVVPQFTISNPSLWHHYVFRVDKSIVTGLSLYVDGVAKSCSGNCGYDLTTVGDISNSLSLAMGTRNPANNGGYLAGSLDDVRVYNRVLSAQEISDLYALGSGGTPSTPPPPVTVILPPATPPPARDTIAPVISSISASPITTTGATISWTTDESADTQIDYGLTTSYGSQSPLDSTLQTSHSVVLNSLQLGTTYHYRVKSKDQAGNLATSGDQMFATTMVLLPVDTTAPVISNAKPVGSLPSDTFGATLSVTTDEDATCRYSITPGLTYALMTNTFEMTGGKSHSNTIVGLTNGANYTYYIRCLDGAKNVNFSDVVVNFNVENSAPIDIAPVTDDDSVTVLAGALNLTGQKDNASASWIFYNGGDAPEGAFMGWMFAGAPSLNGIIRLPKSLAAGKYYVFVKGVAYFSNMRMNVSLGGSTAVVNLINSDYNKYWTTAGAVDITSPSDTLSIRLLKGGAVSTTEKFLIRGIYITLNPSEVVFKDDTVMDLAYPTVMDTTPAVKGNVFENSDFEVGTGHGWNLDYTRGISQASMWDTSTSKYGKASLKLPLTGESSGYGDNRKSGSKTLYSRTYTLKPNKKYTLSAWVKTDVADKLALTMSLSNLFGMSEQFAPPPSYPPQHRVSTSMLLTPGNWQRISVSGYSLKYPTSDYLFALWTNTHESINGSLWVDGIQLEEGDLADYRPAHDVEIGLVTERPGNIYFEDESNATLLAYNSTAKAVTKEVVYEVYDYLNRKVKSGSQTLNIPANTTQSTSLNINPGKRGIFRIVFWVNGEDGTEEEVSYSVVPRPNNLGLDESSVMGIHPNYLDFQLEELQRLGIKWARATSPAGFFRWSVVEPVDDQFVWYDEQVQRAGRYGITTLGTLSTNNYWPAWAADPVTGFMKLDKWEEFVGQIVDHYKKLGVHYWEIWNEPNYTFPPAFYAQMMKRAADAIEANDPNAKIVGMGGAYGDQFFRDVITQMELQYPNWNCKAPDPLNPDCSWKGHFDYLATHQYPIAQKFDAVARYSIFNSNYTKIYGTPVWNTEAGAWDLGFAKGPNSNFISFGKNLWGSAEADRYYRGSLLAPELTVVSFLHNVGNDITKYFYYDSRIYAMSRYLQHHPTLLEYDDTIRSKGIAYSIAGYFVDHTKALGFVNLNANTFAYIFDKGGVPILALWTKDLSSKSLMLPLASSQIRAYDIMGNPLSFGGSTVPFGRTPIYIKGQGISIDTFQAALKTASVSSRQDTTAPSVSISEAPRGQTPLNSMRIRWIAVDETSVPGADTVDLSIPESDATIPSLNTEALLYSYRLKGLSDSWSNWSSKTSRDYILSAGSYTFEVKAKDQAGNVSSTESRAFTVGQDNTSVVSGPCSTTLNTCSAGVFSDTADSAESYLWSCVGSNGGTTASCSLTKPVTPPPSPSSGTPPPIVPPTTTQPPVPASPSLGGGGGGGAVSTPSPTLPPVSPSTNYSLPTTNSSPTPSGPFTKPLNPNDTGEDVRKLQTLLIAERYNLTETGVFDAKTEEALKNFQCDRKIVCFGAPNGGLGPTTKGSFGTANLDTLVALNKTAKDRGLFQTNATTSPSTNSPLQPKSTILSVLPVTGQAFKRTLTVGSRGEDVRALQKRLNAEGFTIATGLDSTGSPRAGSPGNETTYFGPATRLSVIRFQEKYKAEILTPNNLTRGTGFVGQATLKKLQSVTR